MKKILALSALALMLGAASAFATDMKGALGFHTSEAPIGIRYWFTPTVAFDAAVGFGSSTHKEDNPVVETKSNGWNIDLGLPFSLKKWDKVNFMLRPGVMYGSSKFTPPSPGTDVTFTSMQVSGEFEAEVMIADNVSLSAAHGIAFNSTKDDRTPETKDSGFSTTGNNFTRVGFHVYLW